MATREQALGFIKKIERTAIVKAFCKHVKTRGMNNGQTGG